MEKDYIVTKSNKLIVCNYDLSLQEQKIILTLASMVQPQDTEFQEYEFKIRDFIKLLGIKDEKKYIEIPKITKELMKKVFEIKEGTDIIQLSWLSSARYKTGKGSVVLSFDKNLKPYMLGLKELYTSYRLENVLSLRSKYSIRLYEILKSNLFKKCIDIDVEELKKMVGANEKTYIIYGNLKSKILIQAQKELQEKTDVFFEFEEIKTGRKVTSLKFYIHSNKFKDDKQIAPLVPITEKTENEVAATLIEPEEESPIKKIMAIMYDSNITTLEAKKIYDSSKKNLETIKKVYDDVKNKDIPNFIGWMISMVKPGVYMKPKKNYAKGSFNDYEQRKYDGSDGKMTIDELEKELLGWNKGKVGKEFQQLSISEGQ